MALLFNGCLRINHLINLVHTCLQSFDTQIIMEWLSYEVWQRLSNDMPVYFAYYAGIMLDALVTYYAFYYAGIIGLGLQNSSI